MFRFTFVLAMTCALAALGRHDARAQAKGTDPHDTDPQLSAFIAACDKRLAAHRFFSRVTLLKWTKASPFIFYLQRPPREDPKYTQKVVNSFLPFLEELLRIFEKEYAVPLKLQRRASAPGFAIAVLASRGSYAGYAQAVQVVGLHRMRAHYDSKLQLAVTFVDAFAPGNSGPEERHAILHEVVHALQHAYSTTGEMPKPVWFNEGLAEYRSACTSMASSLRTPLLDQDLLMTLAYVLGNTQLQPLFAPLSELVASESYADVLKRSTRRFGDVLTPSFALQVFYAQSAAVMDFLHSGEGGRHRQAFQRYADAAMRGNSGVAVFEQAISKSGGVALPDVEAAFRRHVVAEVERRLNIRIVSGVAVGSGAAALVLPPPTPYDSTKLAWHDDELGERVTAARARCAAGDYEAALVLLHDVKGTDGGMAGKLAQRVGARAAEVLQLRDKLLALAQRKGHRLAPTIDGVRRGGRLVALERHHFVLKDKKTEHRLPLTVLGPKNLANELLKRKLIERSSWQKAWLDWLSGRSPKRAMRALTATDPLAKELHRDLQTDFDSRRGAAGAALVGIQGIVPAKDAAAVYDQLECIRQAVRRHGKSPLFLRRQEGLKQCVRALAQRAFSLEDPRCLGLTGAARKLGDGRITVRYAGSSPELGKDFQYDKAYSESHLEGNPGLATSGSYFRRAGAYYELGGSGVFTWSLPLRGRQVIEVSLSIMGSGLYSLLLCGDRKDSRIECAVDGTVIIADAKARILDQLGTPQMLYLEKVYKLRVKHDGKGSVEVSLNGKRTAKLTRVGSLTRGTVALAVHGSNPLRIHSLTIEGAVDLGGALQLRKKYVERVLRELWP